VTGTKGKSTTSAMLERMLARRYTTWLGGNIGGSLLPELARIEKTHLVVLELSSYMLHYLGEMRWSPHVAVVTLIATDHVEWHGSAEAYLEAKRNLLRFQRPDDFAVLSREVAAQAAFTAVTKGKVVSYPAADARPFDLRVPGRHNQFNAQAAFVAASIIGVEWDEAQDAMREFSGLPHRLELVHESGGVRYFNDSIATIPEAAVAALESFPPRTVVQIVGGSDKKLPLTAMCAALCERAKAVLCIGTLGPKIADFMADATGRPSASVYRCGDLATAMKTAKQIASPGDVVLLSTGCASYDQFRNFEERGEAFGRLAKEMQNAE
jgi:UDP-N-acetylmuramoylalanine--D-glutamate ligase